MKKGSFMGLLYREYYLGRNSYFINFISFTVSALLGLMAVLSMKYGNFSLVFGDEISGSTGILKSKETAAIIRLMILTGIKYMPLITAVLIGFVSADVSSKDTMTQWNRFEHCSPVTPMRYAAVKLMSTFSGTAVSFALALIYMLIVTFLMSENFTYGDFSVIVLFITAFAVFGIISQIFITLLGSNDKGMLASLGVMMLAVFIISFINAEKENDMLSTDKPDDIAVMIAELTDKAQAYCPIALAVLVIAFTVLFVSMYLLYKRREK